MNGMNGMNPKVDAYLRRAKKWRAEMEQLRTIVLDCQLTEELKWRIPCYTFQKKNVVLINGLKDYCSLAFFKGALLKDPHGILSKPGENTRAARLIRFTSVGEILELEDTLKAYIAEAIEVEKAGLKVDFSKHAQLDIPVELEAKFDESPELAAAFEALTPGRQRAYLLHFSQPKQSKTRTARIEKCSAQILAGKGMHDDYLDQKRTKSRKREK